MENPLIRQNPDPARQPGLKAVLRKVVIYTALLIAGLLAIPACMCTFLMDGVRNVADRILKILEF